MLSTSLGGLHAREYEKGKVERVGVEPTTCGSEEPDSTISTTVFHDWLPSLKRRKRLSGKPLPMPKIFMNSCWQK